MFHSCDVFLRRYCLWLHCICGFFSLSVLISPFSICISQPGGLIETMPCLSHISREEAVHCTKANQIIADSIELHCEFEPLFTLDTSISFKALPLQRISLSPSDHPGARTDDLWTDKQYYPGANGMALINGWIKKTAKLPHFKLIIIDVHQSLKISAVYRSHHDLSFFKSCQGTTTKLENEIWK